VSVVEAGGGGGGGGGTAALPFTAMTGALEAEADTVMLPDLLPAVRGKNFTVKVKRAPGARVSGRAGAETRKSAEFEAMALTLTFAAPLLVTVTL